jgi:hypothetical protein
VQNLDVQLVRPPVTVGVRGGFAREWAFGFGCHVFSPIVFRFFQFRTLTGIDPVTDEKLELDMIGPRSSAKQPRTPLVPSRLFQPVRRFVESPRKGFTNVVIAIAF